MVIGRTEFAALRSASLSLKRPDFIIEALTAIGHWFARRQENTPEHPTSSLTQAIQTYFWAAESSCHQISSLTLQHVGVELLLQVSWLCMA